MFLNFVGRKAELTELRERYDSDRFEFIVIYGRRRVGKTTLIKKFMENRKGIYFLCDRAGTGRNTSRFKRNVARFLDEPPIESNDLYDIFDNLANKFDGRAVIILDEFSYLAKKDNAVPSIFQHIIDENLGNTRFMLILCGSSMSKMEKGVLSYKSPLYGRKTGHIRLRELDFPDMQEFYPRNSPTKNIEFYSVLGGVPHYLEKFSDSKSTRENIQEELFSKTGRLYEEVEFLLREEFREPDIYKSLISAMGAGCTRVVEIANRVSMPAHNLPGYMRPLLLLGIIKKEYSAIDVKEKKPRYYIKDNLVNFWFTFCEPFKSELEVMETELPMEYLEKNFNTFVGHRFEEIVYEQYLKKIIPFRADRIGRLWYGDIEIDAMATRREDNKIAFIEIKFREGVDPNKLKEALEQKLENLPIRSKGAGSQDISFLFIAKSFTKKIEGCYTLEDLMKFNS